MNEVWALVPVKAPAASKTRLSSILQPKECASLSRAMFMDVFATLAATSRVSHIVVLTDDDEVAMLAEQLGHTVVRDECDGELCAGLNTAARYIADQGANTMLVVPGDMPTITPQDIEQLLERHQGGLSLCPAIRDGGTNALVCSPPDAMPFQFGKDSAKKHLAAATDRGLTATRLPLQAFFRDIDIPDDLNWLSNQQSQSNTLRFLRQSGIFARLGPGYTGLSA
jgi:2-phospho-L-lactate guanylyltransferase